MILALVVLLVLAQLGDVCTTYVVLAHPGGYEQNKILAALMKRFGLLPTLVVVKGGVVAAVAYAQYVGGFDGAFGTTVLLAGVVFYIWLLDHNVGAIMRQKGV